MPIERSPLKPPAHLEGRNLLRWQELARMEKRLLRGLRELDELSRVPPADKEAVILSSERQLNRVERELRELETKDPHPASH